MGSIAGSAVASHPIPPAVSALLQRPSSLAPQAGFSSSSGGASPGALSSTSAPSSRQLCWVLAHGQLVIWRFADGLGARLITITVPAHAQRSGPCFVSVLTTPAPGGGVALGSTAGGAGSLTTALIVTAGGEVLVWPNVEYLTEPISHQVALLPQQQPAQVTAFSTVAPAPSSGVLFVGALAWSDGTLHLVQGSTQGMHSKLLIAGVPTSVAVATTSGAATDQPRKANKVLSALGHALANAYTEAFDPHAKFVRRAPSGKPAVSLLMRMVDVHHLHIYLLTESTLDCWQVTVGMRLSEQLLWSSQTTLAASAAAQLQSASNKAMALSAGHTLHLLVEGTGQDGHVRTWLHRMCIKAEGLPVHVDCEGLPPLLHPPQGTFESSSGARGPLQVQELHACASPPMLLLLTRDKEVFECPALPLPTHGQQPCCCVPVSDDPDTLAVGTLHEPWGATTPLEGGPQQQQLGGGWLVVNSVYGVLELHTGAALAQSGAGLAPADLALGQPVPELTAEQKVQVSQVLDATLAQAAAVLAARQPLLTVAMGLRRRLQALHVLASAGNAQVLAAYSTGVVDMLPKQWSLGGVSVSPADSQPSTGHDLTASLLAAKSAQHALLLQAMAEGGVLHALPPAVLVVLLENAEKLAAASSVLALHAQLATAATAPPEAPPPPLVVQVVVAAGHLAQAAAPEPLLPPPELFYARPSASLPALLLALGRAADEVRAQAASGLGRPGDASVQELLGHVCSLGQLLGHVVSAVHAQQSMAAASYRLAGGPLYRQLGVPSWLADKPARDVLDSLSLACQAVRQLLLAVPDGTVPHPQRPLPAGGASSELQQLAGVTYGCVEVLLAGFADAMATAPSADVRQAVLEDYQGARLRCLTTLLADALACLAPAAPLPHDCLLLQVQQLAAAHHCYPVLFAASERVDTWPGSEPGATMRHHMAHVAAELGVPAHDTFARYAFQRLLDEGRPADLLQLPPSFYPVLVRFLQQQPQHARLLWPLLLRTGAWAEAEQAITLDAGAQQASYGCQRRLYCLSLLCAKLSRSGPALGPPAGSPASKPAQEEAPPSSAGKAWDRITLLNVQHDLLALSLVLSGHTLPGVTRGVMEPLALADAALAAEGQGAQGRGAMLALRALAACEPAVQQANRARIQAAWQHLLHATDWSAIEHLHSTGSASSGWLNHLQQTPLYQAVVLCCGSGLLGHGHSVADSAPTEEVRSWIQEWAKHNSATSSACGYATQAFDLAMQMCSSGASA